MTAASDKHKNHNGNSKHKDAWDSKVGQYNFKQYNI